MQCRHDLLTAGVYSTHWGINFSDLEILTFPMWGWSAYEHEEVYIPLVSSPEGKNWCECNVDMIY
jgi:hypothetical protein